MPRTNVVSEHDFGKTWSKTVVYIIILERYLMWQQQVQNDSMYSRMEKVIIMTLHLTRDLEDIVA